MKLEQRNLLGKGRPDSQRKNNGGWGSHRPSGAKTKPRSSSRISQSLNSLVCFAGAPKKHSGFLDRATSGERLDSFGVSVTLKPQAR